MGTSSEGYPLKGALLLLHFSIGTLIPLLTFGTFASTLNNKTQNKLLVALGVLVTLTGLMMISRGFKLLSQGKSSKRLRTRITPSFLFGGGSVNA